MTIQEAKTCIGFFMMQEPVPDEFKTDLTAILHRVCNDEFFGSIIKPIEPHQMDKLFAFFRSICKKTILLMILPEEIINKMREQYSDAESLSPEDDAHFRELIERSGLN